MRKKKPSNLIFDELHSLESYYEPMQIDIDSKSRRRELADLLIDAFLFFFSTYEVHRQHDSILTKQLYARLLADQVSDAVSKVTGIDSYMSDHIREMSKQVVNTTFEKENNVGPQEPPDAPLKITIAHNADKTHSTSQYTELSDTSSVIENDVNAHISGGSLNNDADSGNNEDYWLSYRRAEDIAKSEANTFLNYTDYVDAKNSGKTKKTWLTMLDDKVRTTHSEIEGRTIGIDEMFYVGNSLMKFPHDLSESPDPKEVIGCRCSVLYS